MSTRLSLSLAALALSLGTTVITTALPAHAGGEVSIEQRGWTNGAAGSQRGLLVSRELEKVPNGTHLQGGVP